MCNACSLLCMLYCSLSLFRLSVISRKCNSPIPGSKSIKARLLAKMTEDRDTSSEDAEAKASLSFYLREREIGVELLGIPINLDLVLGFVLQACFYLPTAVLVLDHAWHKG